MYGIPIILSYTTRKRRKGERETYRFVDRVFYDECLAYEKVFESTEFGGNYYWTVKSDFENCGWIIIVGPIGVRNLKREFPDCKVVYIKTDCEYRNARINDPESRTSRDIGRFDTFPCNYVLDNNEIINSLLPKINRMIGEMCGNYSN